MNIIMYNKNSLTHPIIKTIKFSFFKCSSVALLRLGCCAVQDPHEAVAVRVVVYGGGDGLGPAHQDQVEAGVALVHQVPRVLVLVPLREPLEVLRVELVPEG